MGLYRDFGCNLFNVYNGDFDEEEYREKNKDKNKEYQKKIKSKYKEYHKEYNKIKVICNLCDKELNKNSLNTTQQTKTPIKNINIKIIFYFYINVKWELLILILTLPIYFQIYL